MPSNNVLEVNFTSTPSGWADRLKALPDVKDVTNEDSVSGFRPSNGPATTMAMLDAAAAAGVTVHSLAVQSTSLDDVFVHYTGRALRDALQDANPQDSAFMMRR